jgi:hypothetical protein
MLKHDLGGSDYALLNIFARPTRVRVSCSSTKIFPPDPAKQNAEVETILEGMQFADDYFKREFPDHVCTSACDETWKQQGGNPLVCEADLGKAN